MIKTPAVAYTMRVIRTTSKSKLQSILDDMPLRTRDLNFIKDVSAGLSQKELAAKYNVSISRVAKWKRDLCEKFLAFDQARR